MKKILKLIMVIIACGFFSCNDDLNENLSEVSSDVKETDLAKNYLTFFTSKSEVGSVLIQSSTSTAMQNINKNITFAEKTSRKNSKNSNSTKRIEIKDFNKGVDSKSIKNSAKDNYNFFGKVLSYKVVDNASLEKSSSENSTYEEVYIPKLINASFSTEKLLPDTIISWNIDDSNNNGVVISLEYYATSQLDTKLAFDNTATIKKSFVVNDSEGSYKITLEDLEIFPNKALIDINVLRAGFDKDVNSDLSIAGLTKVGNTKVVEY